MRPSTVVTVRIVIASLGVVAGLLAGIPFAVHFRNYNAAGWAFVSSSFAAFVLILHVKHKNLTLRSWLPRLRTCMLVGCVGQLAGVSVMVAYISLAVVLGQNLRMLYGENYWIALVWGWMTWKWAFAVFYYSRAYRRLYIAEMQPKVPAYVNDDEPIDEQ
ncbi:Heme transporter hrg-1 [Trichinella zimbabwensis]|uniref:Heme transporter hrg-1 n=1 Tax=Trichinella zimbabwensis TaxID=268475 RepID=A0A0V1HBK2_9BILA|nr:Heme transporter hrg-1 [Trichinella zimbabwensis]